MKKTILSLAVLAALTSSVSAAEMTRAEANSLIHNKMKTLLTNESDFFVLQAIVGDDIDHSVSRTCAYNENDAGVAVVPCIETLSKWQSKDKKLMRERVFKGALSYASYIIEDAITSESRENLPNFFSIAIMSPTGTVGCKVLTVKESGGYLEDDIVDLRCVDSIPEAYSGKAKS